jgi:hypothetical protein
VVDWIVEEYEQCCCPSVPIVMPIPLETETASSLSGFSEPTR